ncbi:hypothetical protein HHK36_030853 [Tetracentron sinense]|uniref:Thioredoxin domain-containing protein n=1 Tax=Tetracentron sinense TaxID=13715 RepID=A0A834YAJ9_TETSI|nr:hypothetical protein HHK36_030853 [Tetracentron sinense]
MMARVAFNPVGLHRFRPSFQPSQALQFSRTSLRSQNRTRSFRTPNPVDSSTTEELCVDSGSVEDNSSQATGSSQDPGFSEFPNKNINKQFAVASIFAALGLFLSARLEKFGVSLKDLSAAAVPYEAAISNGMPTVVEFYADWCEVCRELALDVNKVEQQYK